VLSDRSERRRLHLERFTEIDEAVAEVQRELEIATGQPPGSAPEWDEVTLAAVRALLGLVQRHRAGDLVLVEPGSGLAVRIRHDVGAPSAGLVAVPQPVDGVPAPGDVVDPVVGPPARPGDPLPHDRRDDLLGAVPEPRQPGDGPGGGPLRALHPDVHEELEDRRRAAWQRSTRHG
jgi:hypothetical protein